MSHNIVVPGGTTVRLPTAGKYCDRDILVTAEGGGLALDVVTASALPSAVVDGQIVVITNTAFNNVYVSTEEPASPAAGDILIALENGAEVMWGVSSEPYFLSAGLSYAAQYSGTAWTVVDAYYGVSGEWVMFSTTLPAVGTSLDSMAWADISKVAKSGKGADYFKVGDAKSVALNGTVGQDSFNITLQCKIIGINHNKAIEGNGIHFQFGWLSSGSGIALDYGLGTTGQGHMMNSTNVNAGGWRDSYMRNTLCTAFIRTLPAELQAVIRECVKYTDNAGSANGGDTTKVTATSDKIWLLSEFETFGKTNISNPGEKNYQAQYAFYAAGNSKVRYKRRAQTTKCIWWLRSPNPSSNTNYMTVTDAGGLSNGAANTSYGLAPCFRV